MFEKAIQFGNTTSLIAKPSQIDFATFMCQLVYLLREVNELQFRLNAIY